jgi:hypothetical protein
VTAGFALPVDLHVDHVPDRPCHREEQPFKQRETPRSPSPPGTGCRQRAQREPGATERGEGKPVDGHVLKCARLAQYGRDERVTIHMGWKEPLVAALAAVPDGDHTARRPAARTLPEDQFCGNPGGQARCDTRPAQCRA